MTTAHVVSNDDLGAVSRRYWEVQRRMMEGTLDPSFIARNLQLTAEGISFQPTAALPNITSPFFANEEMTSNREYPAGFTVKPVCEQLVVLASHFPKLNASPILSCSKEITRLPVGAEGTFVIPKWQEVAGSYNEATEVVLAELAKTHTFKNWRQGELGPKYLKLSERTEWAHAVINEKYPGNYVLMHTQFGHLHRSRSVRRVRVIYAPHEFGLGPYEVGVMLLAHSERLKGDPNELHIDCPGGESAPDADGNFGSAPCFFWYFGGMHFATREVGSPVSDGGSASAFLAQ